MSEITFCRRCGKTCQSGTGNPNARIFRRANKGLCADCAITQFLKSTESLSWAMEKIGAKALYNPDIQRQIAAIMTAGNSDASPGEINWQRVIELWDLPVKPIKQI